MLRFSKKVEYALIALVYMSEKNKGELTTARELAEKYDISLELMGKLMQKLARYSFIASIQGVKGGYYLIKGTDEITLGRVIEAIDGPLAVVGCLKNEQTEPCSRYDYCRIRKTMREIQGEFTSYFDNITLSDFMSNEKLLQSDE
ncbi:Rrf2 family transcriptional regulator [candidate division KSB1 bacterium]|nr:Rrf2 family transcriptional regulator [candidate division KSB1 bacterium]